jgi:hypothetical protein
MIDPDRLTTLTLACDFTYRELEGIASQFLGLDADAAHDVMADPSMERKVADLVAWADRQGLLNELTTGILGFGRGKRAVREWVLNGADMANEPTVNSSYASLERRFERMESSVHDRLTYVERELQRLSVAVLAQSNGVPPLNWTIILVAIIVAVVAGLAVFLTGRLT